MQEDVWRSILKAKALERWENEGGKIYTGGPPTSEEPSMDMRAGKISNDGAQFESHEGQNIETRR